MFFYKLLNFFYNDRILGQASREIGESVGSISRGPTPETVVMNSWSQMVGGLNRLLPKEINENRFFWDSHWLEIWSNHFCPSMGPNGGTVAMDSGYAGPIGAEDRHDPSHIDPVLHRFKFWEKKFVSFTMPLHNPMNHLAWTRTICEFWKLSFCYFCSEFGLHCLLTSIPDPQQDPLVRSMDLGPSFIKQNSKKTFYFYCFVTFYLWKWCKCTFRQIPSFLMQFMLWVQMLSKACVSPWVACRALGVAQACE